MRSKKKPTRLKDLKITSVDVCDVGANQEAHMRIAKRDDSGEGEDEALTHKVGAFFMQLFKRATGQGLGSNTEPAIDAALETGEDDVDKAASTFAEAKGRQDVWRDIDTICCAMRESFCGIVRDEETDNAAKKRMLLESVKQVEATLNEAVNRWMGGSTVKKKNDAGENADNHEPDITGGTEPVQKGMVDMNFDVPVTIILSYLMGLL